MNPRRIRVFERGELRVGERGFLERDLEAIARWEERERMGAFSVGWKKVCFGNHVGVFATGDLALEILPKAERPSVRDDAALERKWARAFARMLSVVHDFDLEEAGETGRMTGDEPFLDVFARHFLAQVGTLLHGGLAKGYRRVRENVPAVKGKVFPPRAGLDAVIHQERLECEYDVFDRRTPHNRLLALALAALARAPVSGAVAFRSLRLFEDFPPFESARVGPSDFETLRYDRRTAAYRPAMEYARLILLGLAPTHDRGDLQTLALLFGMNELFEGYIGSLVRRAAKARAWSVTLQASRRFWERRTIRPDVVIRTGAGTVVLDTKWKVLEGPNPAVEDLRQMYAYDRFFGAERAWLVYPQVHGVRDAIGRFQAPDRDLSCGVMFVELFKDGELDQTLGENLLDRLARDRQTAGSLRAIAPEG